MAYIDSQVRTVYQWHLFAGNKLYPNRRCFSYGKDIDVCNPWWLKYGLFK